MRIAFFLSFCFWFPLFSQGTDKNAWETGLEETVSLLFSDPLLKEEKEISKRSYEKNANDTRNVRTLLKLILRDKKISEDDLIAYTPKAKAFVQELEKLPHLGGVLYKGATGYLFQMGDWSDFYEDGFSRDKIRMEGQIPSFPFGSGQIYFFIKPSLGTVPTDASFIGWESKFFVFGDDGSLRYTNDISLDPTTRLGDFRKTFDKIRKAVRGSSVTTWNDLHTFIVPGERRPIYYIFLFMRLLLFFWTLILLAEGIRSLRLLLKNQLPENPQSPG